MLNVFRCVDALDRKQQPMNRTHLTNFRGRGLLRVMLVTSLVAFESVAGQPQEIALRPGQPLLANGVTLDVGDYAIPCVADWNGDGHKDLLVGYQPASKIALFLNSGSDVNPVLTGAGNLKAGGVDICLPAVGCGAPAPFVCDYDNDGRRDLLAGSGADGCVYFYRNTNTDAAPILDAGVKLMAGSSPLTVTYRATPCVVDWDGDGLDDLICGNGDGWVYFFKNTGTAHAPAYVSGTRVQAGGADLNSGIRALVRMVDWDLDGLIDLVGSSDTNVYWCKNIGSPSSSVLSAPKSIGAPVAGKGLQPITIGPRMRLDLVDWDADGVMDLLIGRSDGTVYCYNGYKFAFTSITSASAGSRLLQWNSASYLTYQVLSGINPNLVTDLLVTNCASGGNVTAWTNYSTDPQRFYRIRVAP